MYILYVRLLEILDISFFNPLPLPPIYFNQLHPFLLPPTQIISSFNLSSLQALGSLPHSTQPTSPPPQGCQRKKTHRPATKRQRGLPLHIPARNTPNTSHRIKSIDRRAS
jgi:hypothetical protein